MLSERIGITCVENTHPVIFQVKSELFYSTVNFELCWNHSLWVSIVLEIVTICPPTLDLSVPGCVEI